MWIPDLHAIVLALALFVPCAQPVRGPAAPPVTEHSLLPATSRHLSADPVGPTDRVAWDSWLVSARPRR